MKLERLTIDNFKALARVDISATQDAVVLAGPNGCGKSCVLDAIRLLKSAYGSYVQDEWQQWLGEFQINANADAGELIGLLQDRSKPLRIYGEFSLGPTEVDYIRANVADLIEDIFWRSRNQSPKFRQSTSFGARIRQENEELRRVLAENIPLVMRALDGGHQQALIHIHPDGRADIQENRLLELLFSTYLPQELGVIDFHGANRRYDRQRLNSVNLTIEASENQNKQNALYNSAGKYSNLKTEMTSAYVRNLLASKADPRIKEDDHLTETLKELFATFFPGKEFLGPKPTADGRLTFLVRLATGGEHDIDDLSSGEKEVVYGYLRLYSSEPKNSMILIDEPELHLNPRLISGLAAFYYRHLGATLGNQLWMVSHSDTLIREAVAHPKFAVFHIQPTAAVIAGESQASPIKAKGDIERVVIDLVGDLAAYRPGAKIVLFESTEKAAFDVQMTCTLFPQFEQQVNPISVGSKRQVRELYSVLEEARKKGHLDARFYAICDADDEIGSDTPANTFVWDVYHIENYLLEPTMLRLVLDAAGVRGEPAQNEEAILAALRQCAEETVPELVAHELRTRVNRLLVSRINLGFDPRSPNVSQALAEAVMRSGDALNRCVESDASPERISAMQEEIEAGYRAALNDGTWLKRCRGRDILKRFAGKYVSGMSYEYFRSLIISRMAQDAFQPAGMKQVIDRILAA